MRVAANSSSWGSDPRRGSLRARRPDRGALATFPALFHTAWVAGKEEAMVGRAAMMAVRETCRGPQDLMTMTSYGSLRPGAATAPFGPPRHRVNRHGASPVHPLPATLAAAGVRTHTAPVIETDTLVAQVADRNCIAPHRLPQSASAGSSRTPCRSLAPPGGIGDSRRAAGASMARP